MFGVLRPGSPERERMPISPTTSPPPPRSLAPMPSTMFNSREELLEGCKDWSATQGYAIVIARSRFNRLWLKCDRGGTYENRRNLTPDQRKRKRGDSRLLGCPFKMIAACRKDGSWTVDTEVSNHNHEPSDDLSAHPTLRRMTDQQLQKVHEMCDAGRSPAHTLEELRKLWPKIKVLTRDIYNARKKYKTQKEEMDAETGQLLERPYQDPNEVGFPGPNSNGRWAWVPDGEEVTNRKSKRKRKSAPAGQASTNTTLDPLLQAPSASPSLNRPASIGLPSRNDFATPSLSAAAQLRDSGQQQHNGLYAPPTSLQDSPLSNGISERSGYQHTNINNSATTSSQLPLPDLTPQFDTPTSHQRPQSPTAPPADMSSVTSPADNHPSISGSEKPKEQVLMSRIEQMEKEQRDQKDMLAKILGAVQGIRSSPGPEIRV